MASRKFGRPSSALAVASPPSGSHLQPAPCELLTPKQFAHLIEAENLRGALEAECRRAGVPDPENVVGDVIAAALETLHGYDFARYGVEGLARWMQGILRRRLSFVRRRHRIDESQMDDAAERRWSQLNGYKERAALDDVELVAEARARLRYAPLTQSETICISARIGGTPTSVMAHALGLSVRRVQQINKAALAKIRAVPADLATEPDLDYYIFRLCSRVSVYHSPVKLGSALDRERLAKMR